MYNVINNSSNFYEKKLAQITRLDLKVVNNIISIAVQLVQGLLAVYYERYSFANNICSNNNITHRSRDLTERSRSADRG